MPNIENEDPEGRIEAGVILNVTGAESENDAILAVENYLRVNQNEVLTFAIKDKGPNDSHRIELQ